MSPSEVPGGCELGRGDTLQPSAAAPWECSAVPGLQQRLEWALRSAHSEGSSRADTLLSPRVGMELHSPVPSFPSRFLSTYQLQVSGGRTRGLADGVPGTESTASCNILLGRRMSGLCLILGSFLQSPFKISDPLHTSWI